jgi:hypothetical protein
MHALERADGGFGSFRVVNVDDRAQVGISYSILIRLRQGRIAGEGTFFGIGFIYIAFADPATDLAVQCAVTAPDKCAITYD